MNSTIARTGWASRKTGIFYGHGNKSMSQQVK